MKKEELLNYINYFQEISSIGNKKISSIKEDDLIEFKSLHDFITLEKNYDNFINVIKKNKKFEKFYLEKIERWENDVEENVLHFKINVLNHFLKYDERFQQQRLLCIKNEIPICILPMIVTLKKKDDKKLVSISPCDLPQIPYEVINFNNADSEVILEKNVDIDDLMFKNNIPAFDYKSINNKILPSLSQYFKKDANGNWEKFEVDVGSDKIDFKIFDEKYKKNNFYDILKEQILNFLNNDYKNYYHNDSVKVYFGTEDIQILGLSYEWVKSGVNLSNKMPTFINFLSNKNTLPSSLENNKNVYNFSNHIGNMNILKNQHGYYGYSLSQRNAINLTNNMDIGETFVLNGPPGTGKTKTIQGILSNIISHNILQYFHNKEKFTFEFTGYNLDIPKSLVFGSSFTNQAVKNIVESFKIESDLDVIWSKRWISSFDEKDIDYGVFLNDNNHNLKYYESFLFNKDAVVKNKIYYIIQYLLYSKENDKLLYELMSMLGGEEFDLSQLDTILGVYSFNYDKIGNKLKEKILKKYEFYNKIDFDNIANLFNNIIVNNNIDYKKFINFDKLSKQLNDLHNSNNSIDNRILVLDEIIKNLENNQNELNKEYNDYKLKSDALDKKIEILKKDLVKIEGLKNEQILKYKALNKAINDLESKLLFKIKKFFNIKDDSLLSYYNKKENIKQAFEQNGDKADLLIIELDSLKAERVKVEKEIEKYKINHVEKNSDLLDAIHELEKINQDKLNNKEQITLIVNIQTEFSHILTSIKYSLNEMLSSNLYSYLEEDINNIINNIDKNENNYNSYKLFIDINILLDNSLRFEIFHLSMRYREWLWIKISESLLFKNNKYIGNFGFKNSGLYKYYYWSLILPLFVSTLHSLSKNLKLYHVDKKLSYLSAGCIDYLFLDECGQISPEVGAIGFYLANKVIAIGDIDQIEPVYPVDKSMDYSIATYHKIINKDVKEEQFAEDNNHIINCHNSSIMKISQKTSKYKQYESLHNGLYLTEHRRCPKELIDYCNKNIYNNILDIQTGYFDDIIKKESSYIQNVINEPWKFIHVNGIQTKFSGSSYNKEEAVAIYLWIERFIADSNGEYNWNNIGKLIAILTPFNSQADQIKHYFYEQLKAKGVINSINDIVKTKENGGLGLTIGTVHALQGAEKKVILFSLVYNDIKANSIIIKQKSILNVAISRAKLSFIIFGKKEVFENAINIPNINYIYQQLSYFK